MISERPAKGFPPGRLLAEELSNRNWSQLDLAQILGRHPRVVNEIVKGKRSITPETAIALGGVFETGPEFWMNMEAAYQLSRTSVKLEPIAKRAQIYKKFPVREMQKRGWLKVTQNLERLEKGLEEFFCLDSIDDKLQPVHAATKRSSYEEVSSLQIAWLQRAKQISRHVKADKFDKSCLSGLYEKLRELVSDPGRASEVSGVLGGAGIRLVVVEALPGSKIDGACFWLDDNMPVVALSLRYDRHDMFWHALFHELDHIEHDEGRTAPLIDRELFVSDAKSSPAQEVRANSNAANHLVATPHLEAFVREARNSYSEERILLFAKDMKVHPGIVVGQLQHREFIQWSSYNFLKAKIRPYLDTSVLVDGFGRVVK